MDTVILAAGRGSRLEGVAAPFWKPLFAVNGEPLIVRVVRQGTSLMLGRVVVVVSPENALPICQVLAAHGLNKADVVVQPSPGGPGDAFLRAAPLLHAGRVLILCADNVITDDDIEAVVADDGPTPIIGYRTIEDRREAMRFTLVDEHFDVVEGDAASMAWPDGLYRAWVGPLIVDLRSMAEAILGQPTVGGERKIGANLGVAGSLIEVDAYDIGSPDGSV